jgi:hypothetical protein
MYHYLRLSLMTLIALGLFLILVLSTEAYFSYAPAYEETVEFVLKEMKEAKGYFTVAPGFQVEFHDVKVAHSVPNVAGTHVVLGTVTSIDAERVRLPTRCYMEAALSR